MSMMVEYSEPARVLPNGPGYLVQEGGLFTASLPPGVVRRVTHYLGRIQLYFEDGFKYEGQDRADRYVVKGNELFFALPPENISRISNS